MQEMLTVPWQIKREFEDLEEPFRRSRNNIWHDDTTDVNSEEYFAQPTTFSVAPLAELVRSRKSKLLFRTYKASADLKRMTVSLLSIPERETSSEIKSCNLYFVIQAKNFDTSRSQKAAIHLLFKAEEEVLLQVEEWGIEDQVFTAIQLAEATFRNMRSYDIRLSTDPELPNRKRIRIILTVTGSPEKVFEDEIRFKEKLYSNIDAMACELINISYNWEKR